MNASLNETRMFNQEEIRALESPDLKVKELLARLKAAERDKASLRKECARV